MAWHFPGVKPYHLYCSKVSWTLPRIASAIVLFQFPGFAGVRLEVFDTSGRLVSSRELGALAEGQNSYSALQQSRLVMCVTHYTYNAQETQGDLCIKEQIKSYQHRNFQRIGRRGYTISVKGRRSSIFERSYRSRRTILPDEVTDSLLLATAK